MKKLQNNSDLIKQINIPVFLEYDNILEVFSSKKL